jgi:hypothetical protein
VDFSQLFKRRTNTRNLIEWENPAKNERNKMMRNVDEEGDEG